MREEYEYEVVWLNGYRDQGKVIRETEDSNWLLKPKRKRKRKNNTVSDSRNTNKSSSNVKNNTNKLPV